MARHRVQRRRGARLPRCLERRIWSMAWEQGCGNTASRAQHPDHWQSTRFYLFIYLFLKYLLARRHFILPREARSSGLCACLFPKFS